MATVQVIGNAKIEQDRVAEFIDKIGTAVTTALGLAPNKKSIYYQEFDDAYVTAKDKPEITFFVYTAPDKTVEQKRQLIANINAAVEAFFGADEVTTVVIIKIHDGNNVGVNGVLRADANAAAAQAAAQAAARE